MAMVEFICAEEKIISKNIKILPSKTDISLIKNYILILYCVYSVVYIVKATLVIRQGRKAMGL